MNTFYKYTSNFGVNFFNNPKVKLSNPSYLNDPFESEAGDNLISVLDESLHERKSELAYLDTRTMANQLMKSYGIFSVSETPRNPLMWAHYAEEHSGLCIGYSRDIFNSAPRPEGNIYALAEYEPRKINYDNYRFDRQTRIETSNDFIDSIKSQLLTKSDEWIYEKEHRCIIPFFCATSFSVNKRNGDTRSSIDKRLTITRYLSIGLECGDVEKIGKNEYIISSNKNNKEREVYATALSTFGCVSFLYRIDPKHINSIHLGYRTSTKDIKSFYNMINEKNSKLSHIKLYKFKLSTKRFELLPEVIDESYIFNLKKRNI